MPRPDAFMDTVPAFAPVALFFFGLRVFAMWGVCRSDQIGLSLPSPRASACGMGIVHTFLTQEVSVCHAWSTYSE